MKKIFVYIICLIFILTSFPVNAQNENNVNYSPNNTTSRGAFEGPEFKDLRDNNDPVPKSAATSDQKIQAGFDSNLNNPGSSANRGNPSAQKDPSFGGLTPTASQSQGSKEVNAASEAISCTVGGLLANALNAVVSAGVSSAISLIPGVESVAKPQVPTNDVDSNNAEVGYTFFGIPILPGWNSIGYCLANTIIIYVADSTIEWIQSGFEGKPIFADDPTKLFQDIADYEMSDFLGTLGDGFLCKPFEPFVTLSLVDSYTSSYSDSGKCTLDSAQGNVEGFFSGDSFDYNTFFAVTQNPANNPSGAFLLANDAAQNKISVSVGTVKADLELGSNFFSWRVKDGPNAGKIMTPGKLVNETVAKRFNLDSDRLVLAEKFDQVVSSLVNQLLKTAVTESFGAIRGSN